MRKSSFAVAVNITTQRQICTAWMITTISVLIQKSTILITCQKYCSIVKIEFYLFIFVKILQVQSYRFTEETIKIWTKQI